MNCDTKLGFQEVTMGARRSILESSSRQDTQVIERLQVLWRAGMLFVMLRNEASQRIAYWRCFVPQPDKRLFVRRMTKKGPDFHRDLFFDSLKNAYSATTSKGT